MRRRIGVAILTTALAVAALSAAGCAGLFGKVVKRPVVTYESVNVSGVSFDGVSLDVNFNARNENPFPVPITGYDYSFAIGGHTLASGEERESMSLPANGARQLRVPVQLQFSEVFSALDQFRTADELPYAVSGSVIINAGPLEGITIPFSYNATLPVPKMPDISIETVRARSVSLTGAALDVVVRIRNSSMLDYRFTSPNTSLFVNGRRWADVQQLAQGISLPAHGEQTVTIPITFSASEMLQGLLSVLQSGDLQYRLTGDISLLTDMFGSLPLELDRSGSVELVR